MTLRPALVRSPRIHRRDCAQSRLRASIRIWNPDLRPQFTQQWNLTLEYQLSDTSFRLRGLRWPQSDAFGGSD